MGARRYLGYTGLFGNGIATDRKNAILARVRERQDAIKLAREQANLTEAERQKAGEPLLGYVFGE